MVDMLPKPNQNQTKPTNQPTNQPTKDTNDFIISSGTLHTQNGYYWVSFITKFYRIISKIWRWGARGIMVIVVGIGHDGTSSNLGRDWLHFT